MTAQDRATEAQLRRTMESAFRRASERAKNSPEGMREIVQKLRQNASRMRDSGDRDAMLRLAAEVECRATDAERRHSLRRPDRPKR
jgi:hypothetical protein